MYNKINKIGDKFHIVLVISKLINVSNKNFRKGSCLNESFETKPKTVITGCFKLSKKKPLSFY